jgi:hypothetical protein
MKERVTSKDPGIKPFTKSYEQLNEKQQQFIDSMAEGYHKNSKSGPAAGARMRIEDAYSNAGYTTHAPKQAGWRLFMQTKHIIYKRRAEMVELNLDVNMASEIIREIMMDAKQPGATRLKAAESVLTRQGFDKPQEIILTQKIDDMSKEEIASELQEIMNVVGKPDTKPTTTSH